jgi:hypothetical protein
MMKTYGHNIPIVAEAFNERAPCVTFPPISTRSTMHLPGTVLQRPIFAALADIRADQEWPCRLPCLYPINPDAFAEERLR